MVCGNRMLNISFYHPMIMRLFSGKIFLTNEAVVYEAQITRAEVNGKRCKP
jgi:hypothetical protein